MSKFQNKAEKVNKSGVITKVLIKNDLISSDLVMEAKGNFMDCIVGPREYTTLVSVTFNYDPIITDESHGKIMVEGEDMRKSGGKVTHSFFFPTNKRINISAVGFGQSRTSDGCPIRITMSKQLLGLELDTVVGELKITPQFRCSVKIPDPIASYLYSIDTRQKCSPVNLNGGQKKIGNIPVEEEIV